MAGFVLPSFNLEASVWIHPNVPATDDADFTAVACQKYLASRAHGIDSDYTESLYWAPHIIIRAASGIDWGGVPWIWEIPTGSGKYYRLSWRELMHEGFPNEYEGFFVAQANNTGVPEARGIIPY